MYNWRFFAEGSYNKVYINEDRSKILKIRKRINTHEASYDEPSRSVRLWNLVNGHILPPAYTVKIGSIFAWVCPYVKGEQANDEEIKGALIDIFNSTRRVVIDAISPRNFIKTEAGKIVCVDIGFAVEMDVMEDAHLARRGRRSSDVSFVIWTRMHQQYHQYLYENRYWYFETIETIKALIFIRKNRPDIFDVNFLKDHPEYTYRLSIAYDQQLIYQDVDDVIRWLGYERGIDIPNIKEYCILELKRYIEFRGSFEDEIFKPSSISQFFRNPSLTSLKVAAARNLIEQINDTFWLDDIKALIESAQLNQYLIQSHYTRSGFASCLRKCMTYINAAELARDDLQASQSLIPR